MIDLIERNQVVRSLVRALDCHKMGEQEHSDRVSVYAVATGEKLGLSDNDLLTLRYAAQLHDVGKIAIRKELLYCTGTLSDFDFGELKLHATQCRRILEPIEWLKDVIPIICAHHEYVDGSGYPEGLRRDRIPIESRIIAVCETFDVMTNESIYRMPVSEGDAIAEMSACSGTQFDPAVVEAFTSIVPLIQPLNGM